jgi:hypothetical protein
MEAQKVKFILNLKKDFMYFFTSRWYDNFFSSGLQLFTLSTLCYKWAH